MPDLTASLFTSFGGLLGHGGSLVVGLLSFSVGGAAGFLVARLWFNPYG